MGVVGLAHAAFNVTDMDRAIAFYHDLFGFEKAFEMPHYLTGEPWIVYMHVGKDQFLELFYGGVTITPYAGSNAGFSHLCLEVNDINEIADKIVAYGASLDAPVRQGADGNWQCWTHDPDGIKIELMQLSSESPQMKFIRSMEN